MRCGAGYRDQMLSAAYKAFHRLATESLSAAGRPARPRDVAAVLGAAPTGYVRIVRHADPAAAYGCSVEHLRGWVTKWNGAGIGALRVVERGGAAVVERAA